MQSHDEFNINNIIHNKQQQQLQGISNKQIITMLSAIDAPKSKTITIAFLALKSMLLGLFLIISFKQLKDSDCSDGIKQLAVVFQLFYILGSLLDLFLLFYFIFTNKFNRMQYFIMFTFHLILAGFTIIVSIIQSVNTQDCPLKSSFLGATLALSIIFIVSAIFIMWCNLYFGLKFGNLGCNLLWTFMWIQCLYCGNVFVAIIGVVHGLLSVIGLLCFIVTNFMKKSLTSAKCWKQIYFLSIIMMIFCYVISFIASITSQGCQSAHFFVLTYQKYGAIQIIAPILLLIFMNTQLGDPRQNIIRDDVKNFWKNRENQNFVIDDTN